MSIPQALLRDEIPRNEAYIKVRRSASRPEGRGMRVTQQMGVFRQPLSQREISLTLAGCTRGSLFWC
jgi:hypothetical protein